MSTPEFGRILDEPEETVEFGRLIEEAPPFRGARPGAGGKAALRGAIRTAQELPESLPGAVLGKGLMNLLGRVTGRQPPPTPEPSELLISELGLEDPEAGLAEKSIEKAVEILPFLLGGEGGLLAKGARALLAGGAGQVAQEAGLGDLGEAGAELLALGLPGLGKRIAGRPAQREGLEMLRRRGLTEGEIAPLIPSERKSAALGKLGTRGFRTEKAAKRTREALGNVYGQLAVEGEALPILSSPRAQALQSELQEKLARMPSSVRNAVQSDMRDLFSRPVKANDIMNFWQDLNANINWKSARGGRKRLNELKDVLLEGMQDISPEIARDFELTNEFYSKFGKLSKNLATRNMDSWLTIGETAALMGAFFKYGPVGAARVLGVEGARRLASEMLINPRLQNLSQKMSNAILNNKVAIARKLQDQIQKELEALDLKLESDQIENLE